MTSWRFIDSGACDAVYNMALDEAIAVAVRNGDSPPALRFYGWDRHSVSLGSFQKIADVDMLYCDANNIPVVRRPTGGRGILHGEELTYSFSSRNEGFFSGGLLEAYRQISATLQAGLIKMGLRVEMKKERETGRNLMRSPLCFQSTSYGEVCSNGKKLIGSAQKRWNDGFLQQGSIPYSIDYEKLTAVFKQDTEHIILNTGSKYPGYGMVGLKELVREFNPEEFKQCIKASFEDMFGIKLVDSLPSVQEQELALLLCSEKYQNQRWTKGAAKAGLPCNNAVSRRALQG